MNGMSSHVLDFDDTHLKTVIHPAGPVAPAILALAEMQPMSGRDFLHALILGVEVGVPHRQRGVSRRIMIAAGTSPAPPVCSARPRRAASCSGSDRAADGLGPRHRGDAAGRPARDVRLDDEELPSRPGRTERLDRGPFRARRTSPPPTSGSKARAAGCTCFHRAEVGRDHRPARRAVRTALNTYKPFACGIVMHPTIDACLQLRDEHRLTADQIERIDLQCIRWCSS